MGPKTNAFLLALVIFAAGAGAGILIDHFFVTGPKMARFHQFKKFMGPQRFDKIREHLEKKLTRELSLDAAQQEQMRAILDGGLTRLKEKAAEHDAEIEAMKEAMRQEFAGTLQPAQLTRFWELVEEFKARRAKARQP